MNEFKDTTLVQDHIDRKVVHKYQKHLIDKVTKNDHIIRSDEFVDISPSSYQEIESTLATILHHFRGTKIHDITQHVCGNSSLGLRRYAVLIQGHKKNSLHMIDLKQACQSIFATHTDHANWDNDAERIVSIQKMMQADSPFLLSTLMIGKTPFIIKEMQPSESKISFGSHEKHTINKKLIDEVIHVLVHDQLSACDILGVVTLPDMMEYAQKLSQDSSIALFVLQYADQNNDLYQQFYQELTKKLITM